VRSKRLVIETLLSASSAVLCVLTLAWPDWIEGISGWGPDHHSGTYEILIVAALFVAAMATGRAARRTCQRLSART
jgi:hypothetical protein